MIDRIFKFLLAAVYLVVIGIILGASAALIWFPAKAVFLWFERMLQ